MQNKTNVQTEYEYAEPILGMVGLCTEPDELTWMHPSIPIPLSSDLGANLKGSKCIPQKFPSKSAAVSLRKEQQPESTPLLHHQQ